jgi:Leucine rich repeat
MWPEVKQVKESGRRELNLSGAEISQKIEEKGLDENIFTLTSINLLNISATTLTRIPKDLGKLENLQTLMLFNNKIEEIDVTVFQLEKLKMLDLSNNAIKSVPQEINKLQQLFMLNISGNLLESFPDLVETKKLNTLDLSNNKLTTFPNVFNNSPLVSLAELKLKGNLIVAIPDEIDALTTLKLLDLSENKITHIPKSVAAVAKLKDLELKGNCIADKRLTKLIDQCKTKQVVDYVKQHGAAVKAKTAAEKSKGKTANKSKTLSDSASDADTDGATVNKHKIIVEKGDDTALSVFYTEDVAIVRPHILCCLVKNVRFDAEKLKNFLQIQTKLHDTICEKREAATIATHDLNSIKGPVKYTAKLAKYLEIQPLGNVNKMTGQKLFDTLKEKADLLRKEKKRNVYSGIHK